MKPLQEATPFYRHHDHVTLERQLLACCKHRADIETWSWSKNKTPSIRIRRTRDLLATWPQQRHPAALCCTKMLGRWSLYELAVHIWHLL